MTYSKTVLTPALPFVLLLSACDVRDSTSVVFVQRHTLGISLAQSETTQAPEFNLGYSDANAAVMPAFAVASDGRVVKLGGESVVGSTRFHETYSVLGQFEAEAPTEVGANVGLGKFFATGAAAQKMSAGFACAVSDGRDVAHCHPPSGSTQP
ncbi:MAG: hypothetical protein AB3N09_10725 [Tateyamaria sp.]